MNFGSGINKFDLDRGSGVVVRSCPWGSSNPGGTIRFECLPSGMWNLTRQTCYDCPALREKFMYSRDGQERDIILHPAQKDAESRKACRFNDGSVYSKGHIKFRCDGSRWRHVSTTCSHTACRPGHISLDFFGDVGKVSLAVPGRSDIARVPCPSVSANTRGHVVLKCNPSDNPDEPGDWTFVEQTCQRCHPTSLTLTVEEHFRRKVMLPGGDLGHVHEESCIFDTGAKIYSRGHVQYKCGLDGWKLYKSTCRDWVCPNERAVMKMQYWKDGRVMVGQANIHLKAAVEGDHEHDCPQGTLDPSGSITFECLTSGAWRVARVACGNGEQVDHQEGTVPMVPPGDGDGGRLEEG